MNKKVIIIITLTITALFVVHLYSFGPLAKTRLSHSINQQSAKPTAEKVNLNNQQMSFNTYHNKDTKEDYYSVKTPSDWQIGQASTPGSYDFTASNIIARAETMDVPDNTTLELYVLSQEEPRLKKESSGYKKIDYQKVSINGSQSYQLTYQTTANGKTSTIVKIYITGTDKAGVVTVTVPQDQFTTEQPIFATFINSFTWENL
jgi:hypothetical protein